MSAMAPPPWPSTDRNGRTVAWTRVVPRGSGGAKAAARSERGASSALARGAPASTATRTAARPSTSNLPTDPHRLQLLRVAQPAADALLVRARIDQGVRQPVALQGRLHLGLAARL